MDESSSSNNKAWRKRKTGVINYEMYKHIMIKKGKSKDPYN